MDTPARLSWFSLALGALLSLAVLGAAVAADGAKALRNAPTAAPAPSPAPTAPPDPSPSPKQSAGKAAAKRRRPDRAVVVGPAASFARVGGVELAHPARRVERIAFHQASDVASLAMSQMPTAVRPTVLPSRRRASSPTSAVDVVIHPADQVLAPVSGVVKRAGTYLLYCKDPDGFAVISPDAHPELEVKLLHISGVSVRPGDRVVAGRTVVAARPTPLPFASQVDAFSSAPAWPHVHLETTKLRVPSATPVAGASTLAMGRC